MSATAVGSVLLAAILSVCQEWAESLPHLTQVPGSIELSLHAIKNSRRKMEDRHAVCVDINSLFGLKVCCVSDSPQLDHLAPGSVLGHTPIVIAVETVGYYVHGYFVCVNVSTVCTPCRSTPHRPTMLCLMATWQLKLQTMPQSTSCLT